MKNRTLLKAQSATGPWPERPPFMRLVVLQMKDYVSERGGYCSFRFSGGVLFLAIRGLACERVSELVAAWRRSIKKHNEPTVVEQFDGELMPPKPPKAGQGQGSEAPCPALPSGQAASIRQRQCSRSAAVQQ